MKILINPNFWILQDIKLIMPTVLILLFTLFIMVNIITIIININVIMMIIIMIFILTGDSDPVCFLFSDQATAGSAGTGGQRLMTMMGTMMMVMMMRVLVMMVTMMMVMMMIVIMMRVLVMMAKVITKVPLIVHFLQLISHLANIDMLTILMLTIIMQII